MFEVSATEYILKILFTAIDSFVMLHTVTILLNHPIPRNKWWKAFPLIFAIWYIGFLLITAESFYNILWLYTIVTIALPIIGNIFVFRYIVGISYIQSIIVFFFAQIIAQIFANLITIFSMSMFHLEAHQLFENLLFFTIVNVAVYIPYYMILFLVSFYITNKVRFDFPDSPTRLLVIYSASMILILFSVMLAQLFLFKNYASMGTTTLLLLNTVLYSITFIGFLYGVTKFIHKSYEIESQKFYNSNLEVLIDELRVIKHGTDNMMASILGFVDSGEYNQLKEFVMDYSNNSSNGLLNNTMLSKIKSAGVKGILINKFIKMDEGKLKYRLVVEGEVENINMKMLHFCEALGILLDNAIDGALESSEKRIKLIFTDSAHALSVEVVNSVGLKPNLTKMFQKNWSTRGEGRGIGLWRLRKIVDKTQKALLNTEFKNNELKQVLIIAK
jgi:two-component system sensor histidine kinase AgrC